MNLIYGIKDKPKFGQMLIFAFQQVLAILAATIAVPAIIGNGMSQAAALFGAGIGLVHWVGLDTAQFDPLTMESKLLPGLYVAGEMLDVDGDCGGYNLMFAFAGGLLAGQATASR